MKILFILGLGQTLRPERWSAKHHVFHHLGRGLAQLGVNHTLLANPQALKPRYTLPGQHHTGDIRTLAETLANEHFHRAVIWGGRSPADVEILEHLGNSGVKPLFSEAGWFPQSGHCYFSPNGTNAACRLLDEGLREHVLDRSAFERARRRILQQMIGWLPAWRKSPLTGIQQFDISRPILLPLQDEQDMNIRLDSPTATMQEFVEVLARQYPDVQFIARPHPRAPAPLQLSLPNVEIQRPGTPLFRHAQGYGGIIGINSTTLLEFTLLGLPVACVGRGLSSGTGTLHELDLAELPPKLDTIQVDHDLSAKTLDFLLRHKQVDTRRLSDPRYLANSYFMNMLADE